jgi:hypothetical protein
MAITIIGVPSVTFSSLFRTGDLHFAKPLLRHGRYAQAPSFGSQPLPFLNVLSLKLSCCLPCRGLCVLAGVARAAGLSPTT